MTLEAKQSVSTFFANNWTETPIHYYGLEFDITGIEEWIMVEYIPVYSGSAGISYDNFKQEGRIEVTIYARKENRVYEIYDILLTEIRLQQFNQMVVRGFDIMSKDILQTVNGDYRYIDVAVYLRDV